MNSAPLSPGYEQGNTQPVIANRKFYWILAGTALVIAGATIWLACTWQICWWGSVPYPCCK